MSYKYKLEEGGREGGISLLFREETIPNLFLQKYGVKFQTSLWIYRGNKSVVFRPHTLRGSEWVRVRDSPGVAIFDSLFKCSVSSTLVFSAQNTDDG